MPHEAEEFFEIPKHLSFENSDFQLAGFVIFNRNAGKNIIK